MNATAISIVSGFGFGVGLILAALVMRLVFHISW